MVSSLYHNKQDENFQWGLMASIKVDRKIIAVYIMYVQKGKKEKKENLNWDWKFAQQRLQASHPIISLETDNLC